MTKAIPRPAATLMLLRAAAHGIEILMLQRAHGAAFLGGAYVFPGGARDAADADPRIARRVLGLTAAEANRRLKLEADALAYYAAAVRECFEESGLVLLCDARGRTVDGTRAASLQHWRERSFADLLESEDLYIPGAALAYCGHWITPADRSRRFDARFFVALAPQGQQTSHDRGETVHHQWISPAEALARAARREIELVDVTRHNLADLARFSTPGAAFAYASSLPEIDTNRGCRAQGRDGPRYFTRADPQYFEIHWSDPDETGETSYDMVPGEPKRLDRHVTRLTAPNPGAMTGPGINTYLVGEDELAVIDPGPNMAQHVEKILELGRIRWILCTHTHPDQSSAAAALKAATGATPLDVLAHGERLALGTGLHLRAIRTPGHASSHLCYLLEESRMLFTGDLVAQGSTLGIDPPDSDPRAYLAWLAALLAQDIAILAPGRGYLIGEPRRRLVTAWLRNIE